MDSLEKVSGVREKEETHGEIGVRKGVERCCKIERGQETRPREGEKVKRGWERVKRERRKRRRGATKKNRRGYIGLSIREGSCLPSLSSFPNTPSLCPCLTPLSLSFFAPLAFHFVSRASGSFVVCVCLCAFKEHVSEVTQTE